MKIVLHDFYTCMRTYINAARCTLITDHENGKIGEMIAPADNLIVCVIGVDSVAS